MKEKTSYSKFGDFLKVAEDGRRKRRMRVRHQIPVMVNGNAVMGISSHLTRKIAYNSSEMFALGASRTRAADSRARGVRHLVKCDTGSARRQVDHIERTLDDS